MIIALLMMAVAFGYVGYMLFNAGKETISDLKYHADRSKQVKEEASTASSYADEMAAKLEKLGK